MPYALIDLPKILKEEKLRVTEVDGWKTRGHGNVSKIKGVMIHHCAGPLHESVEHMTKVLRDGRPDLAGPLCNLGLQEDGVFYVFAAGKAYHAGPGEWLGVTEGNSRFIGIECVNTGGPEDEWEWIQKDALARACRGLMYHYDFGVNWIIGHKEWAPKRKVDPSFDMEAFRDLLR